MCVCDECYAKSVYVAKERTKLCCIIRTQTVESNQGLSRRNFPDLNEALLNVGGG